MIKDKMKINILIKIEKRKNENIYNIYSFKVDY